MTAPDPSQKATTPALHLGWEGSSLVGKLDRRHPRAHGADLGAVSGEVGKLPADRGRGIDIGSTRLVHQAVNARQSERYPRSVFAVRAPSTYSAVIGDQWYPVQ